MACVWKIGKRKEVDKLPHGGLGNGDWFWGFIQGIILEVSLSFRQNLLMPPSAKLDTPGVLHPIMLRRINRAAIF